MEPDNLVPGGGSGGDAIVDEVADTSHSVDGTYEIDAQRFKVVARPPLPGATAPNACCVSLLAAGTGADAFVDIRGSQGVRVTTGPPPDPPMHSDSTNGVEVITSEGQSISLQRGLVENVDQRIDMKVGSITVDGGTGSITLKSKTQITLQVCGGTSSITLTPTAIIINGPVIKLN